MKRWILALLVMLAASPGWAAPRLISPSKAYGAYTTTLVFSASDSADSDPIGVSGFCSVRATIAGSDAISLYAVTAATTAASSGTLLKAFSTSTSPSNPIYTFTASTQFVKAKATSSSTGGSTLVIDCAPLVGAGGGGASDADGDGYYEAAYLWDADGDGSTYVTCTGDATPDIACKASGEIIYRDVVDDINCAVHGCGIGQMARTGTIFLGNAVYVAFPCWKANNPGSHTPTAAESNDNAHDAAGDLVAASAAGPTCATDSDGKALHTISLQDWQGQIIGAGFDTRNIWRGNASTSLRRDRGTYVVNDMGPWHASSPDNLWFGDTDPMMRMISAGFAAVPTNTLHQTGGQMSDGDSKGWWKVYDTADIDFETWGNDNSLCVRHSGGTVGTDYKAASTVTNLRRGDVLLVPVKPSTNATAYSVYEVRVRDTPSSTCGASSQGIRIPLGGDIATSGSTLSRKTYPAFAGKIVIASGQAVIHARSDYSDTDVVVSNLTLAPQDFWNEYGGRCTNSGSAFYSTGTPGTTDNGTLYTVAGDDSNTDFSCDTTPLFGFWGSGRVRLQDVAVTNWHQYAIDGGSTGGTHMLQNARFLYGNGGPFADTGPGWEFRNIVVDQSSFSAQALSVLGPGFIVEDLNIRNSSGNAIAIMNAENENSYWEKIRMESSAFDQIFDFACSARRNTFRDVLITGRGYSLRGGVPAGFHLGCSTTSTPITQNLVDGFIVDTPDFSGGNNQQAPLLLYEFTTGNEAAIFGNTFNGFRSLGFPSATANESGCLFGAYDFAPGGASADGGESVVFTENSHTNSHIESNGSVFCVSNAGADIVRTSSELNAITPSWGDPVGCGNFDGTSLITYERCDAAELGNGTLAVDFGSMLTTACSSAVTTTLTGLTTTDSILWGFVADQSGTTGYTGSTSVVVRAYPTANTVNFKACNPTGGTVDPGSVNLWWKAVR